MNAPPRAPAPPTHDEERKLAQLARWTFSESLWAKPQPPAPGEWGGLAFGVPRRTGGLLAALLFEARDDARGVLVMGHPAVAEGKGFFHLNNRLPFARNLGLHVVTFDLGGFGESDGPTGLYHSEWEDMIGWARRRFPDLPLSAWGVGAGGYFAHHALSRDPGIAAAVFEDVPADLSRAPALRLARLGARLTAPAALRWLPAEAHAPHVRTDRALYAYAEGDEDAARLWAAAGPLAQRHVVRPAGGQGTWAAGGEALRDALRKTLG